MHKTIHQLLFLLFVLTAAPLAAQMEPVEEPLSNPSKYRHVFDPFEPGDTTWVFGDKVNVRSAAQKDAAIAFKLVIGDMVVVLDTAHAEVISGQRANWYKIRSGNGNAAQTGFVWGGLLARSAHQIGNVWLLSGFTYGKASETDKKDDLNMVLRAARNGQLLSSVAYDDLSYMDNPAMMAWQIPNLELKRFSGGVKMWVGYEACGYPQQDMYVFWDGAQLVKLPLLSSVADGGVFAHSESYIFPYAMYEADREAQQIYYRVDHNETAGDGEDLNEFDEWSKQRVMKWNGKAFVKPTIKED